MGRRPTVNGHLPPHMRARQRRSITYYYFDAGGTPRKEIPLGSDYTLAVQTWAKLNISAAPSLPTVGYAIARYLASTDYLRLCAGTQADYGFALDKLRVAFGSGPLDQVRPTHVAQYLERRSAESRHRALREVAVLAMVYRYARAHDLTTADPVAPVKRGKLPGRKAIYIEDDVLQAVYEVACQPLKDALDLAYAIGQRPGDVLALQEGAIKDGTLSLRQTKTGTPIRIAIAGALEQVLARILERKRLYTVRSLALLVDERGQRMTKAKLRGRFEKAREQVPEAAHFQFRDLRAKAATDLREEASIEASQALLGHTSVVMTEQYTRNRQGKTVTKIPARIRSAKPKTGALSS